MAGRPADTEQTNILLDDEPIKFDTAEVSENPDDDLRNNETQYTETSVAATIKNRQLPQKWNKHRNSRIFLLVVATSVVLAMTAAVITLFAVYARPFEAGEEMNARAYCQLLNDKLDCFFTSRYNSTLCTTSCTCEDVFTGEVLCKDPPSVNGPTFVAMGLLVCLLIGVILLCWGWLSDEVTYTPINENT